MISKADQQARTGVANWRTCAGLTGGLLRQSNGDRTVRVPCGRVPDKGRVVGGAAVHFRHCCRGRRLLWTWKAKWSKAAVRGRSVAVDFDGCCTRRVTLCLVTLDFAQYNTWSLWGSDLKLLAAPTPPDAFIAQLTCVRS